MELGKAQDETRLEAALKKLAINECCTMAFTVSTCDKLLNQVQSLTRSLRRKINYFILKASKSLVLGKGTMVKLKIPV